MMKKIRSDGDVKDNEFRSISVRTTKKNFKIIHNRIETKSSQFNSDVARSIQSFDQILFAQEKNGFRMASAMQTKKKLPKQNECPVGK